MTFISKLVEYLAWPVAAIIFVLLFRSEIVKAAPFLKKLKAGPVEAEFEREVKQLKETTPPATDAGVAEHSSGRGFDNFIFQLAEIHPRSAVLEAWVRLEAAARSALSQDTSKASVAGYIPAAKLSEALINAGKIDQSQVTLYHELRRLRNEVAHLIGLEPTPASARSYIELASGLQNSLAHSQK